MDQGPILPAAVLMPHLFQVTRLDLGSNGMIICRSHADCENGHVNVDIQRETSQS